MAAGGDDCGGEPDRISRPGNRGEGVGHDSRRAHPALRPDVGNLYFLIVFGDNTEDVLGKGRYLLLVAVAALAGDLAHILADPHDAVPCIGVSGGISGILAYYCLRFPKASICVVYWLRWFRLPVGLMFALWVLTQIFDALWLAAREQPLG